MWTRLLLALTGLIAVMAALIFVPAGTVNYWQAWLFLACYLAASVIVAAWLVRNDRALLDCECAAVRSRRVSGARRSS